MIREDRETFFERLLPAPKNGGFRMDGYYVWCGSAIKGEDGRYHMFASRWPKSTGFPDGYRTHSEIVRAVSDTPEGPYSFQEVVIKGRGGDCWDAQMAHNPNIVKSGDTYVLYYLGARNAQSITRTVGYAWSGSIAGPWTRIDSNLTLMPDSNNPAACIKPDGSVLLAFRYGRDMKIGIASAPSFDGAYRVVNEDILPGKKLEDPYFFMNGKHFEIILEDNQAQVTGHERFGAHLVSEDGIEGWKVNTPSIAYDHTILWDDGTTTQADRRERPQLLFDEQGNVTHLFTGIKVGDETWNIVQPLRPVKA